MTSRYTQQRRAVPAVVPACILIFQVKRSSAAETQHLVQLQSSLLVREMALEHVEAPKTTYHIGIRSFLFVTHPQVAPSVRPAHQGGVVLSFVDGNIMAILGEKYIVIAKNLSQ
jgi:hypothetical protein